jgi:Ser/Thr protein kinase RdoA (MazF antagonist)
MSVTPTSRETPGLAFTPFGGPETWPSTVRAVTRAVADGYGLRAAGEVRDLGGTFKRNLLIRAEGSGAAEPAAYVAHVHRAFITPARVAYLHGAVRALARAGLPVSPPLATRSGDTLLVVNDHVVDVDPYVANEGMTDTWPRFFAAASLLGRIHDLLGAADLGPAVPPVVRLYGLPAELLAWMDETEQAVRAQQATERRAPPDDVDRALALCERARRLFETLDAWWSAVGVSLPRTPTHGDYGTSNVLFRGDEPVVVIDWDLLDERERTYDLARAFRWTLRRAEPTLLAAASGASPDAVRDVLAGLARRLDDAVAAYDAGSTRPLTPEERAALPMQMARVPLYDLAEIGRYVDPRIPGPVQAVLRVSGALERAGWLIEQRDYLATLLGNRSAHDPLGATAP